MAPVIMNHADWMRRTKVEKRIGHDDRTRNPELLVIDGMIMNYNINPNVSDLRFLQHFVGLWMQSKTKNFGRWKKIRESMRNHDGAVTALKGTVDAACALRAPLATNFPGIFIGDDVYRGNHWVPIDFVGRVQADLTSIASRPIGAKLLQDISGICATNPNKQIVIEYGPASTAAPMPVMTNENRWAISTKNLDNSSDINVQEILGDPSLVATVVTTADGSKERIGGAGAGCVVTFNHASPGPPGSPRPSYIALAHELVHAHHYVHGMCYRAATGKVADKMNSGIMEEEMRTVGFGAYAAEVPSENAIRGEHGIALRANYSDTASFDNVTASRM